MMPMRRTLALLVLLATPAVAAPLGVRVIDGDTLAIGPARWRLQGIDAPEIDTEAGKEASAYLARYLAIVGGRVTCSAREMDRFGRYIGVCTSEAGVDLATVMLRSGHACRWERFDPELRLAGVGRDCGRK